MHSFVKSNNTFMNIAIENLKSVKSNYILLPSILVKFHPMANFQEITYQFLYNSTHFIRSHVR